MKKSLHLQGKDLLMFIVRVIWIIAALVIWIIALNMVFDINNIEHNWWLSGLLCCIPIILPIGRFIIRMTRKGHNAGSSIWDVDISSSGHVNITNRGFLWGLIFFLIAFALSVSAGIVVLPIYWIYILITTIKVLINNIY